MDLSAFEEYLSRMSEEVDAALEEFLFDAPDVKNLREGALYSLGLDTKNRKLRGKRIRPVLCLLTCEKLGGNIEKAMPFALACELLHNFLLVHDDIEDQDVKRRDRDAVWVKYGLAHGINIGDYLYSKAYEATLRSTRKGLSDSVALALTRLLTDTVVHTGEGQALDIGARQRRDMTIEDYMYVAVEKTGYYLAAPAIGGAIVAGASQTTLDALTDFGKCIGPIFQIADDIIDLTEGKGRGEKGSDIREGKRSFLVVHAANVCSEQERLTLYDILDKPRNITTSQDVEWVVSLLDKYGAVEAARRQADVLLGKGKDALKGLPVPLAETLQAAAEYMIARNR